MNSTGPPLRRLLNRRPSDSPNLQIVSEVLKWNSRTNRNEVTNSRKTNIVSKSTGEDKLRRLLRYQKCSTHAHSCKTIHRPSKAPSRKGAANPRPRRVLALFLLKLTI
jgi:hypothetical protein